MIVDFVLSIDGLFPKSLFTWSKTFFDKSKACSRDERWRFTACPKLALRAQTVGHEVKRQRSSLIFRFAKIY